MHNKLSCLKVTGFGLHPGHYQTYTSPRIYETTIQSSVNMGKRFDPLPQVLLKNQLHGPTLTQMNADLEQEKDVNFVLKQCVKIIMLMFINKEVMYAQSDVVVEGDGNVVPVLNTFPVAGQLHSTAHCSRVSQASCGRDITWVWS